MPAVSGAAGGSLTKSDKPDEVTNMVIMTTSECDNLINESRDGVEQK